MTRNNSEVALEQDKTQDKRTGRLRIGSSNVAFILVYANWMLIVIVCLHQMRHTFLQRPKPFAGSFEFIWVNPAEKHNRSICLFFPGREKDDWLR